MYLVIYEKPTMIGPYIVIKECQTISDLEENVKEIPVAINEVKIFEVIPRKISLNIRVDEQKGMIDKNA